MKKWLAVGAVGLIGLGLASGAAAQDADRTMPMRTPD